LGEEQVANMINEIRDDLSSDRAYTPSSLSKFIGLCNYIKSSLLICDIHHNLESNIDDEVCKECENMLITGHYWEPKFPKLFYPNQINEFKNLKIIGDITCDINGAVPTTVRSTTIAKPYYSIDINSMKEIDLGSKGIAVMAVDNLPSELPNESSEEFGNSIISEVLPYLIIKDDGRINRATTASKGKFCPSFSYLENFIRSSGT